MHRGKKPKHWALHCFDAQFRPWSEGKCRIVAPGKPGARRGIGAIGCRKCAFLGAI